MASQNLGQLCLFPTQRVFAGSHAYILSAIVWTLNPTPHSDGARANIASVLKGSCEDIDVLA